MTITDKNGKILQSTDIILIETKKGNKLAKILSIFNDTLTARVIKENKYGVITESKNSFNINVRKEGSLDTFTEKTEDELEKIINGQVIIEDFGNDN